MVVAGYKPALGFMGGGAGGGPVSTITFVNSATSDSGTIAIPSEAIQGDYAILFDGATSASLSAPSIVVPVGWTQLKTSAGTSVNFGYGMRQTISHRILGPSPGGTLVTGMNDTGETKILLVFRTNSSIGTLVPSTFNGEMTEGNPSSQTVTASGVAPPLIVFACGTTSVSTPPAFATETPAMTNVTKSGGGYISMRVGYTVYNSSPANQSIDTGDNGQLNALQSGYVRFT